MPSLSGALKWSVLAALALPLLSAACSPTVAKVAWTREGATEPQERRDLEACGVTFDASGTPRVGLSKLPEVDACMRARGYEPNKAE